MLPLWIVDLREKTPRRDLFESLVRELDHVKFADRGALASQETEQENVSDTLSGEINPEGSNRDAFKPNNLVSLEQGGSVKEQIEAEDRDVAERNAKLVGYYWRYSPMAQDYYGIDISSDRIAQKSKEKVGPEASTTSEKLAPKSETEETAEKLYRFQSNLVAEGQRFIRNLRESNCPPDLKINIVVLGDISEDFTRIVFPGIAGMLQKEKGRILASHIHQGVEIIGMLYIPSDINARKVKERNSMRRTLTEIDVQHKIDSMRGYDHMMLYQDVQNRMECHYGAMSDKMLTEYLFQCIVNLYFACDASHPLISGTASADVFYFSMGACSVHFDTDHEDQKARHRLSMNLIRALKSEGEGESVVEGLTILKDSEYDPLSFFTDQTKQLRLNVTDIEEETPNPHPIKDFFAKYLKRYYYDQHIRFFTQKMHSRIVETIDRDTKGALESIAAESRRRIKDAPKRILEGIRDILAVLNADEGGIPSIKRLLKDLKEKVSNEKKDIPGIMEIEFWNTIHNPDRRSIPKEMEDKFLEYHDVYQMDVRTKNGGAGQYEMKKETINVLNGLLSKESTMLSRLCRSVLLGIMLALAAVPILNLISPVLINLGRVARYSEWWSVGIFLVPVCLQFISYLRYQRKKRNAIKQLQALYLHDGYARVANRIESEIIGYYDKLMALADRYDKRADNIMTELEEGLKHEQIHKQTLPVTTFNQPLIGGKFGDSTLLPFSEAEDSWVNINFIRYKLNEIGKREYFIFLSNNYNMITELFKGISLCENFLRRVTPEGKEELVSKDQQEKEQEEEWKRLRDKFQKELQEQVDFAIQPRENNTVGEKLIEYTNSSAGRSDVLRPMIEYAATNGELVSSADKEFLDVKMNVAAMDERIEPHVSVHYPNLQLDRYHRLYERFLFITRWRCFDHFSFNRILPMEDFDEKVRGKMVYEEEQKVKNAFKGKKNQKTSPPQLSGQEQEPEKEYVPKTSSLFLWALCEDDMSQEWYRLFEAEHFSQAMADKETYRKILNQDD